MRRVSILMENHSTTSAAAPMPIVIVASRRWMLPMSAARSLSLSQTYTAPTVRPLFMTGMAARLRNAPVV